MLESGLNLVLVSMVFSLNHQYFDLVLPQFKGFGDWLHLKWILTCLCIMILPRPRGVLAFLSLISVLDLDWPRLKGSSGLAWSQPRSCFASDFSVLWVSWLEVVLVLSVFWLVLVLWVSWLGLVLVLSVFWLLWLPWCWKWVGFDYFDRSKPPLTPLQSSFLTI